MSALDDHYPVTPEGQRFRRCGSCGDPWPCSQLLVGLRPQRPYTLVINRSDSRCGHCGRGANMNSQTHDRILEWGDRGPGCGVRWVLVMTDYAGMDPTGARPDLAYVDQFEEAS